MKNKKHFHYSLTRLYLFTACVIFAVAILSESADAGYFGYDIQGGSTYTMTPSYCWGNKYNLDFYTAGGGEVVDTFIIWCNPQNNNSKVVFGLYSVSGGVIQSKMLVSDTLTLTGSGISRWVRPAAFTLTAGTQYTICIDISGLGGPAVCYGSQTNAVSRNSNAVFPDTWTDDLSAGLRYCVAAHYMPGSVDNLNRRRSILGGER